MKFAAVTQSFEEYFQTNWTYTALIFDNQHANSELYTEYARLSIIFSDAEQRCLGPGRYRDIGLCIISLFAKPDIGNSRLLILSDIAAELMASVTLQPVLPLIAPSVNLKTPSLMKDFNEKKGWIMAQVSCPFYYDSEI